MDPESEEAQPPKRAIYFNNACGYLYEASKVLRMSNAVLVLIKTEKNIHKFYRHVLNLSIQEKTVNNQSNSHCSDTRQCIYNNCFMC